MTTTTTRKFFTPTPFHKVQPGTLILTKSADCDGVTVYRKGIAAKRENKFGTPCITNHYNRILADQNTPIWTITEDPLP